MSSFRVLHSTIFALLISVYNSSANASLKGRINAVELRLNYLEVRVNTDSLRTRSEFSSLENAVENLNLSFNALVHTLANNEENISFPTVETSKDIGIETCKCERERQATVLGFLSEKKWTKNKIKRIEHLFDQLKNHTRSKTESVWEELRHQSTIIDSFANTLTKKLGDQERTISTVLSKMKDIEMKQDYLENQFQNNRDIIEKLKEENLKFREEMLLALNASIENKMNEIINRCPSGWLLFNNQCYFYKKDAEKSFSSAREFCAKFNACIADIESEAESKFINSMAGDVKLWIGVSDEAKEGVWISERTGKVTKYTNWLARDPDGGTSQNCVILGYSIPWDSWIDAPCDSKYQFVCRKLPILV